MRVHYNHLLSLLSILIVLPVVQSSLLSQPSNTIHVPQDYPTLKSAVLASAANSTILVHDGLYFEKNIIIDKPLHIKSKNLFGAVLDGSGDIDAALFIVQAPTEIEGFVLKNVGTAVLQRDSPDVPWIAHHLAVLNAREAIYINDLKNKVGSATVHHVIADNNTCPFMVNDARSLRIYDCLVTNSDYLASGSNFHEFFLNNIVLWNVPMLRPPQDPRLNLSALTDIKFGSDIILLNQLLQNGENGSSNIPYLNLELMKSAPPNEEADVLPWGSMAFSVLASVYVRMGDFQNALDLYSQATELGERIGSNEIVWDSFFNQAKIYDRLGDLERAVELYYHSLELIEKERYRLILGEYRSAFLVSRLKVYESYLDALYRLYLVTHDKAILNEAFQIAEKSKARSLLDGLDRSDVNMPTDLDPDLQSDWNTIAVDISSIQKILRGTRISTKERAALFSELRTKEELVTSFKIRFRSRFPDLASHIFPIQNSHSVIQEKLLDEETALIQYVLGEHHAYAFLLTSTKLVMIALPEPDKIRELVRNYVAFLTLEDSPSFKAESGGVRLHRILLGPLRETLPDSVSRLVISADDCLHFLPFEALVIRAASNGTSLRYLIEDYTISYAPSATSLLNIIEREPQKYAEKLLLAIADNDPVPGKPRMPGTIREAKQIARILSENESSLLLNGDATEHNLKSRPLSNYRILHFASRAEIDEGNWHRSAIILRTDPDSQEDGLFQPRDLFGLHLNAELVVLSACRTRHGKFVRGEGIYGLTRSFLQAGAQSIVSSLWKVDDRATPNLMRSFYSALLTGKTKDTALRDAKLEMIASKFSHPRYWSAFILIGDAQSLIKK